MLANVPLTIYIHLVRSKALGQNDQGTDGLDGNEDEWYISAVVGVRRV
jgi:hypothetical protein